MVIVHSPRCLEYSAPGHPESPERVRSVAARLQREFHTWLTPVPCAEADLLRVHTRDHIDSVNSGSHIDVDTPTFPNMPDLARLAAGAAIQAAAEALAGRPAFSLMRPPGHHAERNRVMGFCYFNNIAVAVAGVLAGDPQRKVAILDFDCHHGNGTEEIFRGDSRVLFVSLHQSPCYPNTGLVSTGNCVNYPLAPGTTPPDFLAAVDDALNRIAAFAPDLLAVSAGFDAYKEDPITNMALEVETYYDVGVRIGRSSNGRLPCFAVLEGGYAGALADCVEAFVEGWGHPPS